MHYLDAVADSTERIARIGIISDTHIHETMESCGRVKAALEFFKSHGVEMVLNCGDLADRHYPDGYRCYRRTVNEVYPDKATRPKEVYVYANHDMCEYRPGDGWKIENALPAFEDMRRLLEDPNGHTCSFVWKGLPFAVFPQDTGVKGFLTWKDYEAAVARLCEENPGKPVFVCDHVPPAGTTHHSWQWGSENCRRVLNRFPQVICISGHVHGTPANERQIWQGEFTAINAGSLQAWDGFAAGSTPPSTVKQDFGVLVMDVFPDRLVVHRCDIRDGSAFAKPWVVPLPFVRETAPYRPAAAALRMGTLPTFAKDSAVSVRPTGSPTRGYAVEFPEVAGEPRAYIYRLECARKNPDGNWETFTQDEFMGDFWIAAKDRTGIARYFLNSAFFTPGERYRLTVTPIDWYGRPARPLAVEFSAVHAKPKTLWSARDSRQFRFVEDGREVVCDLDGFYSPASGRGAFAMPADMFSEVKAGRRYRLVFDIHTSQPTGDFCAWRILLMPKGGRGKRIATVQTPTGDFGPLRYVMEFRIDKDFPSDVELTMNYRSYGGRVRLIAAELQEA